MSVLGETELKNKIKASPAGIYLIYGEEDYLKKLYVDKIIATCTSGGFADFNLHVLDGKTAVLGDIYDYVSALPMMSDYTCVVVNDMELSQLDDDEISQLTDVLESCSEDCALVFTMTYAKTSGGKWNTAQKLFQKYGNCFSLQRKTITDIRKAVEKGAEKRGVPFEPGVANYLIDCVGSDLNTVFNETEKLCAYCLGASITRKDVDEVCVRSLSFKVFGIISDLHAGRFDKALNGLNNLFVQREDPFMILGAFVSSYVDMYRGRCSVVCGKKADELLNYYDYGNNTFKLGNGAENAKGLSVTALNRCIECLAAADDKMKKSPEKEHRIILEQLLAHLALAEGSER